MERREENHGLGCTRLLSYNPNGRLHEKHHVATGAGEEPRDPENLVKRMQSTTWGLLVQTLLFQLQRASSTWLRTTQKRQSGQDFDRGGF